MNAILLCAGYGKRLMPITNFVHKSLINIGGTCLLELWLNKLDKAGVKKFLINTHYKSEDIIDFVKKSNFRNRIKIVYEKELLGTAGTLINNIDFFDNKDGFLIHSDNFYCGSLREFLFNHSNRPKKCLMSALSFKTDNIKTCGIIEIDKNSVIQKFREKPKFSKSNLANGAVYILTPKIIDEIKKNFYNSRDFSTDIIPKFLGKIFTYTTKEFYIDIGDINSLKKAQIYKQTIDIL